MEKEIAIIGKITAELDLKKLIDELVEITQAWNKFVENFEQIQRKYSDKQEESEDKLYGNSVDIDKAVEHYEGTLEALKDIDLEVDE